jgi:hypothetical protein
VYARRTRSDNNDVPQAPSSFDKPFASVQTWQPAQDDRSLNWRLRLNQAAEKLVGAVILRSRRRRRISYVHENAQGEILRFAQNDRWEVLLRSL